MATGWQFIPVLQVPSGRENETPDVSILMLVIPSYVIAPVRELPRAGNVVGCQEIPIRMLLTVLI